ncbi:MAG: STAS/SEC14 domain-containing protein [Pseudomonadota bacterium]
MPLKLEFQEDGELLLVRVSGRAVLADMMDMIDRVAHEARARQLSRVLVDQTQIIEDFKFTDHFAIGEKAVSVFDAFTRAASVVQASRRTGTSENVARRKGAALGVFTSRDDAIAWLRT